MRRPPKAPPGKRGPGRPRKLRAEDIPVARPTVTIFVLGGDDGAREAAGALLRRTFQTWLGPTAVDTTFLEENLEFGVSLFGYRISIRDGGRG